MRFAAMYVIAALLNFYCFSSFTLLLLPILVFFCNLTNQIDTGRLLSTVVIEYRSTINPIYQAPLSLLGMKD